MILRILLFLLLNFAALAIGGLFAGEGADSGWYETLNKAPWTPPGWVFGAAWSTIMITYAVYMAILLPVAPKRRTVVRQYGIQWLLNVSWNPVFFFFHWTLPGLVVILSLLAVVGNFLFQYRYDLRWKSILIVPYFLWLIVAASLNGYVVVFN